MCEYFPLKINFSTGNAIALLRKGVERIRTVDHVACKYWCALQGSGVIKIIINLTESW